MSHPDPIVATAKPPASICLLRLSALGDVTHVLPLLRTLQRDWPQTVITWVIGRLEHRLLQDVTDVEFIVYDKRDGLRGARALRQQLRGRRFDALLQMQVALRANLLSACIPARRRIGFDRARSKDLHGLFVDERIQDRPGIHVLDALGSFCEPLGLVQTQVAWDLPIRTEARDWARAQWPQDGVPTLLISPCSSHRLRNWRSERYAAVADHAAGRGWRVVLCGGRNGLERETADAIKAQVHCALIDLVGRDSIEQLPALLARGDLLLTPDAGPMHIANAVGTKVLGLHAASNPARSGPYSDRRYCVDRYDDAARRYLGRPAAELPWGTKIERAGVMDMIQVHDAVNVFEAYASKRGLTSVPPKLPPPD